MTSDPSDASKPHPRRTTFLPQQEVLRRAREILREASRSLGEPPADDPMLAGFYESLRSVEEGLANAIERFESVAPTELLGEHTQYTVELPKQLEEPPPATGAGPLAAWAMSLMEALRTFFEEMAGSAQKESLEEIYRSLTELAEGQAQRIGRLEHSLRDL